MLPFLKRNQDAGVSVAPDRIERKPDDAADSYDPLHSAAEDLISAVHSKNIKAAAEAMRAAFDLMESEPHDEFKGE